MKLLVVEDDKTVGQYVKRGLEEQQYLADWVGDGAEALRLMTATAYDLVILDLRLPGMTGLEVLRTLRDRGLTMPVLVLTAQDSVEFKVDALRAGADDYVTKPFSVEELLARIRALTRRLPAEDLRPVVRLGDIVIDLSARTVNDASADEPRPIRLTPTEWQVMELLIRNSGRLVTRQMLLTHIWGTDHVKDTGYLRLYLAQLRKKLEPDPSRPRHLLTEPGMGYRLQPDAQADPGPGVEPRSGAGPESGKSHRGTIQR